MENKCYLCQKSVIMNYDNLKSKTILDLTSDIKILDEICGFDRSFFNEEEYRTLCAQKPYQNFSDIRSLANITGDKKLLNAAIEQFKDAIDATFTE